MLFDENNILKAENKRLLRYYRKAFGSAERSADNASAMVRREVISLIFLMLIAIVPLLMRYISSFFCPCSHR